MLRNVEVVKVADSKGIFLEYGRGLGGGFIQTWPYFIKYNNQLCWAESQLERYLEELKNKKCTIILN